MPEARFVSPVPVYSDNRIKMVADREMVLWCATVAISKSTSQDNKAIPQQMLHYAALRCSFAPPFQIQAEPLRDCVSIDVC